jgi:hypothetical protein
MVSNKLTFFTALVLALSATGFSEPTSKTVTVESNSRFCLFLPPYPGGGISENEYRSISFCTEPIDAIPYAKIFPKGFIQSAHYRRRESRYVQITGTIDRDAYKLSKHDEGGQNDPNAPPGAKCLGYPYFVQLLEPDEQIFCLRCCKNKSDCPTDRSEDGCRAVISGDYS